MGFSAVSQFPCFDPRLYKNPLISQQILQDNIDTDTKLFINILMFILILCLKELQIITILLCSCSHIK